MKRNSFWIVWLLLTASCSEKIMPEASVVAEQQQVDDSNSYVKSGFKSAVIVDQTGLDGCGFMIELKDKTKLEPTSLPNEFKNNNLPVWVKFQFQKGLNSVCMSGRLVTVLEIKNR